MDFHQLVLLYNIAILNYTNRCSDKLIIRHKVHHVLLLSDQILSSQYHQNSSVLFIYKTSKTTADIEHQNSRTTKQDVNMTINKKPCVG